MAGFIAFPAAEFSSDPAAATSPASENRYVQQTVVTPALKGNGDLTFDWVASRWIPAGWHNVSTDGRRYAYLEVIPDSSEPLRNRTPIHVVEIATGSDRVVHDGDSLAVLDFAPQGIFLTQATYGFTEGYIKVFLLNPDSSAFATLLGTVRPFVVGAGGGAAWTVDNAPGTTSLTEYRLIGDRLSRVDTDGRITPWFTRPSADVYLLGFDLGGHPIVSAASTSSYEVWIALGVQSATRLYTEPAASSPGAIGFLTAIPDESHGIWFSSGHGVYLYTAAQGMKLVATGLDGVVSGTCGS
jgi:hypothetical protein